MEIQNYPNYLIYPDGRVYSKKIKRFMKLQNHQKGYKQIMIRNEKELKTPKIHRLVAEHYIPNPHNYPQVDHINRDKTDNRVENLRWVSQIGNLLNTSKRKCNKSGYKNINFSQKYQTWSYEKRFNNKIYRKQGLKSLKEALCYKFIMNLKFKSKK